MKLPLRSLAFRQVLALTGVQLVCIMVALIAFPLLIPFMTYRQMADGTARHHLLSSLVKQPGAGLRIAPTSEFRAYSRDHPGLRFAIRSADGHYAAGSSGELVDILQRIGPFVPRGDDTLETVRPGNPGDAVFVTTSHSRFGPLVFVTAGDVFRGGDIRGFFDEFLPVLPVYGPILVGMLLGIPFVTRLMFRPLKHVARTAASINVHSLDQRLPEDRLPSEFAPLVRAINATLDRLSEGWSRQRLFSANAAHELRTPVAVLQARVEMLPSDVPLRAALTRDVRRIGILIDQLLAIARLDRRDVVLRPIELVALLRDLVADWASVAIRGNVTISFSPDQNEIWVLGEARALESAVAALIDNAIKVEPAGEIVEVLVATGAKIFVRDHGPGVSVGDRQSVFEPFWRKDERPYGSGLGLATVAETARLHGGYARVVDWQDGGAMFEMFVPQVDPPRN
ncbi:MAG: HAMP domain-containing histidine kinase [Pseudomonadota bacterium]|nr:HAMP domain-containing histidine kinase [Pseudomonadota bacterium]